MDINTKNLTQPRYKRIRPFITPESTPVSPLPVINMLTELCDFGIFKGQKQVM